MNKLSIVIPACNEELIIGQLCAFLSKIKTKDNRLKEFILVDGKSHDQTIKIASSYGAHIISSSNCSRAIQMNHGAASSSGDILYFVHADVLPPETFIHDIFKAMDEGIDFGCFSYRFDSPSKMLRLNSRFTRKDSKFIGGGDQTLFIKRSVFNSLGGFNTQNLIMEDFELYWRAKKEFKSKVITQDVLVSARKYAKNSYLRVQLANFIVFNAYRLGISQKRIAGWYAFLLNS